MKDAVSAQKSPSRVRDGEEGVAGRSGKEEWYPDEGSLICPPGKSMILYKKGNRKKIVLVARPDPEEVLLISVISPSDTWARPVNQ